MMRVLTACKSFNLHIERLCSKASQMKEKHIIAQHALMQNEKCVKFVKLSKSAVGKMLREFCAFSIVRPLLLTGAGISAA